MISTLLSGVLILGNLIHFPAGVVEDLLLNSSYTINSTTSTGTGFIVEGGLIVTASHVVEDVKTVELTATPPSGEVGIADVIYLDKKSDVAVLKPRGKLLGEPLLFASRAPIDGETVYTVGSALGAGTLSRGSIISGLSQGYVVARIPIEQGYSGGALVTSSGEVLGVVVSMDTEQEGIAYAVPTSIILNALRNSNAGIDDNKASNSDSSPEASQVPDADNGLNLQRVENSWIEVSVLAVTVLVVAFAIVATKSYRRSKKITYEDKIIVRFDNEG
jgi:S1-C subfamily serine protease